MDNRADISVISPGMLSTIQDLGRSGMSSIGVGRGGAADTLSLRVGNRLIGNDDGAAAIEMTWIGGTFEFGRDVIISLTGGELEANVNCGNQIRSIPMWTPQHIRAGEQLAMGPIRSGARTYLCVAGGIDVPRVLNSRSTHLVGAFGGLAGRPLQAGDEMAMGKGHADFTGTVANRDVGQMCMAILARRRLRAVDGAQADLFRKDVIETFWSTSFEVSMHSDRAGLRLQGRIGPSALGGRMASEGMMPGAVQVPESGEPIVLGVDHPTTGGYPVIACVAAVDHAVLGQVRPGEHLRFERISIEEARMMYRTQQEEFNASIPPRFLNQNGNA